MNPYYDADADLDTVKTANSANKRHYFIYKYLLFTGDIDYSQIPEEFTSNIRSFDPTFEVVDTAVNNPKQHEVYIQKLKDEERKNQSFCHF